MYSNSWKTYFLNALEMLMVVKRTMKGKAVKVANSPQLAPVLPKNCFVSEFHKNCLNDSHLPNTGGLV